jgi:hypothetical protein
MFNGKLPKLDPRALVCVDVLKPPTFFLLITSLKLHLTSAIMQAASQAVSGKQVLDCKGSEIWKRMRTRHKQSQQSSAAAAAVSS